MWFQAFEKNVRWDLEKHIRDEEDGQSGVVLVAGKIEIRDQAEDTCVRNVCSIEKGQQVEDAEDRDHSQVNLRDELPLAQIARVSDIVVFVLVLGRRMSDIRIVDLPVDAIGVIVGMAVLLTCD
jgi:hypothetical protein